MREQSPNYFFGIDIGTSAVRCIVGMPDATSGALSIVGHGQAKNIGMRRGVVAHIDDVADAVVQAITEAERVSGVHIASATINVNGSHIEGMNSKGVVAISSDNKEITANDRLRSEEAATIVQLPANREIIQVFAKNYRLDGQDNIKDPVGMKGVRLEVDTHIVTATTPNLRNLDTVLEKSKITASHHTVSSLAAAEAVLNRQQKESGTLLLDIGAGTTNLVVIEDGEVQHVAVIPVGSMHITNDLAIGLKTDLDIAEAVKKRHAQLKSDSSVTVSVAVDKQKHSFSAADIYMITEARIDELFDLVEAELKRIKKAQKLPGGVVIVGGGAHLPGIADFCKEKLQLAARVGHINAISGLVESVEDPRFATAVGLCMLDMLLLPEDSRADAGKPNEGAFGYITGLLKRITN